jgi:hypothetical protein
MVTVRSERQDTRGTDHKRIIELWKQGIECSAIRERLKCSQKVIAAALLEWRRGNGG